MDLKAHEEPASVNVDW